MGTPHGSATGNRRTASCDPGGDRYAPLLRLVRHVPTPEDSAASGEERRRVLGVLAAIRREYAALLLLRSHGCSYDELAATLEVKSTSVGTLLRTEMPWFVEFQNAFAERGFAVLGVCAAGNFRPNMKGVSQLMPTTYSGRSSPKSFYGADS